MTDKITIRASSVADWLDCSLRAASRMFMGMELPSSGRAHLGTALHAASASVDLATMNGAPYAAADVADLFHGAFTKPGYDVDYRHDDATPTQLEVVGLKLIDVYARDWSPKYDFVAVEKQINGVEFETSSGVIIELTGKMDRARIVTGIAQPEPGTLIRCDDPTKFRLPASKQIVDLKTGKRAVAQGHAVTKGHKAQLGVYEIIEEHESGEACGPSADIIGMKTSGKPEIATGTVRNAKAVMLGEHGVIEWLGALFKSGKFIGNPRSALCSPKYCPYWGRCSARD